MIKTIKKNQIAGIARLASYWLWTLGEQAMSMGVLRLVLFPVAAYLIGKEEFGVFVTALSVSFMIGVHPSNGLATGLIRHLSNYPQQHRAQYCKTAMRMSHIAMVIIILVSLFFTVVMGLSGLVSWTILNCLIPLIVSLYSENQFMLILTELRINRKFKQRTLWYSLRACIILTGGIVGALTGMAVGLAWGYALASTLAYMIIRIHRSNWLRQSYNSTMAQLLKAVWFHVTIAGVIELSGPYLNRIILSIWHTYTDVADLFAATSVMYLFLVPISCSGVLLLSLLAKYKSVADLSKLVKVKYFLLIIFAIVSLPFAVKVFGPFVLKNMFPNFGNSSLDLLTIVTWVVPFAILLAFTRPFVVKFAPIQVTPFINGTSLGVTLLIAIILVPSYGAKGAAWSIVIGQAVTGLLWCVTAIDVLLKRPNNEIKSLNISLVTRFLGRNFSRSK